ncbi:MAG: hypothetical protein PUA93_05805 [Eubacteriales bacterium]|nr:hypothetical protein [Eubacteriales bacterium]
MTKKILAVSLLFVSSILSGCKGGNSSSSASTSSSTPISDSTTSSSKPETEKKTLKGLYISPSKMSYRNMRPTYNYYITTFAGEEIELYSDNTYQLNYYSSTFSALTLPEEGNDAIGNERENFVQTFYGTYESKTDELDEDSLDLTLNVPNRLTMTYDSTYFVDTARWDDAAKTNTAVKNQAGEVTKSYDTASDYLKTKAFNKKENILLNQKTHSFDYFALREDGESDPEVTPTTETGGIKSAYLTPAKLTYQNMRPSYNYYITLFTQQQLVTYDDGTYSFNTFSSEFSAITLAEEGNDFTGSDRTNYVQKFMGKDTEKTNELDEDSLDITLATPSTVWLGFDCQYAVNSDVWDDDAKNNTAKKTVDNKGQVTGTTPYETAADYIAATGFDSLEILANKTTNSFDFTDKPAIML